MNGIIVGFYIDRPVVDNDFICRFYALGRVIAFVGIASVHSTGASHTAGAAGAAGTTTKAALLNCGGIVRPLIVQSVIGLRKCKVSQALFGVR